MTALFPLPELADLLIRECMTPDAAAALVDEFTELYAAEHVFDVDPMDDLTAMDKGLALEIALMITSAQGIGAPDLTEACRPAAWVVRRMLDHLDAVHDNLAWGF